ncbi:MAG: hypothetical protein WA376_00435, partial [Terrimicrobiaceae bacterium]
MNTNGTIQSGEAGCGPCESLGGAFFDAKAERKLTPVVDLKAAAARFGAGMRPKIKALRTAVIIHGLGPQRGARGFNKQLRLAESNRAREAAPSRLESGVQQESKL